MPTKRAWKLLFIAIILYFLANQTQVGWLYIITDGLIGLLMVAFFYSRGMLKAIQARRTFQYPHGHTLPGITYPSTPRSGATTDLDFSTPSFHEDDPLEVTLRFQHSGLRPAWQVSGLESCPLAPPANQAQLLFIPGLIRNQPVTLSYQTTCDRRGFFTFAALPLHSKGPFGLFWTRRSLTVPAEVLVYPAYYPLKRLRLFEQREMAEHQSLHLGRGSEIIGTREYRPGDSLRQVHWRSTARTGRLVVKEFTDDEQPAITVVLDLQRGSGVGQGKFSTFETAIRIAASLGYYATRKNIPFRLAGSSKKWTPPATPLSWWAILNYLAKVEDDGQESLAHVLSHVPASTLLVVLVSQVNEVNFRAVQSLTALNSPALVFLITPDGSIPPHVSGGRLGEVELKSVSPHNWAEVLTKL
jgi:uncharacterized protein (DUF58 family)